MYLREYLFHLQPFCTTKIWHAICVFGAKQKPTGCGRGHVQLALPVKCRTHSSTSRRPSPLFPWRGENWLIIARGEFKMNRRNLLLPRPPAMSGGSVCIAALRKCQCCVSMLSYEVPLGTPARSDLEIPDTTPPVRSLITLMIQNRTNSAPGWFKRSILRKGITLPTITPISETKLSK